MRRPLRVEEHVLRSSDGTEIAYHVLGEGPPVVLANGLGGTYLAWRHQLEYLSDRYRFITWDYRGLYRSARPSDPDRFTIDDHVDDLQAILDAEKIDRAAFVGWSMGVQVNFELYRRRPELFAALVVLNGTFGRPWESALDLPAMKHVIPRVLGVARQLHGLASPVMRRAAQWPEVVTWLKRVGMVGETLDEEVFAELAHSFGDMDLDAYLRTFESLGAHDAETVLDHIEIPTLVICGERDFFTPQHRAEEMARRIPGAELLVVPGGTHYVAIEYPELVNLRIEKFFQERGYVGPDARSSSSPGASPSGGPPPR